ncbi:hypothetical protein P3X46_024798 [Hevea brasiliensis]|uniref:Peptidase A2 domain-containing protein n=1 Tax=Hevea brasiliensis TaxID=3981 RepID=A0ABQ9L5D8_HEVBR|nr:hypothetical protein P3X46_024798 [Hevea brasiliensis]
MSTSKSKDTITEKDESLIGVINVIIGGPNTGKIGNKRPMSRYTIRRVLIDTGSSVNFLMREVLEKLKHKLENLVKVIYPLVGLSNKTISLLGTINLIVVLGDEGYKRKIYIEFMVIDILLSYNIMLGRLIVNDNGIVISMHWLCMKLSTPGGTTMVQGSQKSAQQCYKKSTKMVTKVTLPIELLEKPKSQISPDPIKSVTEEELEERKIVCLGIVLIDLEREAIIRTLKD